MTKTILGISAEKYRSKLNKYKALAIASACLFVILNALFLLLRTESNHSLMLISSIAVSIGLGWFLVAWVELVIKPMSRLYELSKRQSETITVKIDAIDAESRRVENFDCVQVYTEDRTLFLIAEGNIRLSSGERATLLISSNIITGVVE